MGHQRFQWCAAVLLMVLISQGVAAPASAEPLTVTRKSEFPTYSEKSVLVAPTILLGGVLGAGIGAAIAKALGGDSHFVAYPTVGIGSYPSAPALMFEGHF